MSEYEFKRFANVTTEAKQKVLYQLSQFLEFV